MLRLNNQITKLLTSIREVTHHLSLTLYMFGKFTNDRFRKMEAWLKFGRLLGSYRVLMFPSPASIIVTQISYRSRLKNLSTQWIETSPCMREPKAIPEHDDLIWSTKYSLRYPRYYYKMFNVQTPRIILDILTLSDILDTTTRCHMSKYYLRYPQILPQIS